ncbi:hypothetical protein FRC09_006774 [Ceratobasidium sp. 395]|nr:hypothetical protein FRC09_006774 [Ceratobasidium sp. 395]
MSNNLTHPDASSVPFYIAKYQGRAVAIKRETDYRATIEFLQKSIPKLRLASVQDIFVSATVPEYGDALVQISEDIWPEFVGWVKDMEITLENPSDTGDDTKAEAEGFPDTQEQVETSQAIGTLTATSTGSSEFMSMSALTASQMRLELYNLLSSTTIGDLKHCMETEYGIPAELQRLDLCGKVLQDTMTLGQCGATDATTFDLSLSTRKTIIYFRPSASGLIFPGKDIKIQIQLNRSWELAMLYPRATGASKDYIQSISWDITVTDAGRIHAGGRTFTGLFWDGM